MSDVQVIKANKSENRFRGRKVEILRVAAYCRVSTDSEDQLNSYKSQVMYYTDLIKKKHDWSLVDIYADEAITGTQVTKREDFQRMINDCMNGDIDMVITKSISRFARNTLDTLKYVRMLKEKGIAVFFEDENINTLTMDGELLLVVLSSVAQQEVENISSNVKKGLKMKMKRGELVGFQGCLGYDYHKETKSISVNEKEAEIVRYIFNRYIEGAGCTVIANELENLGYKTKYGSSRWVQSTVIGIIKNEKYKGDLLLGKTFTVDPISKRRLENFGEEDKFYIQNHHEPIVSEEVFEEAQKILAKRNVNRGVHQDGQKRNKFSRKYAFSCMIKCGFCGGTLTRRNWHSSSAYTKTIWQCVTATKQGKKYCPHCKGIPEEVIEKAFVKSYQLLCSDQQQVVEEFLQKVEGVLNEDTSLKRLPKIEKEMNDLRKRKEKLLDLRLDTTIDRDIYESKNRELSEQLKKLQEEQEQLLELSKNRENTRTRLREFRKNLSSGEILEDFDRVVFESVVEKIIIGGYNKEGVEEPLKITFVYKTGIHSNFNGKNFKPKRRNAAALHSDAELCSYASDEAAELCSHSSNDTQRMAEHITVGIGREGIDAVLVLFCHQIKERTDIRLVYEIALNSTLRNLALAMWASRPYTEEFAEVECFGIILIRDILFQFFAEIVGINMHLRKVCIRVMIAVMADVPLRLFLLLHDIVPCVDIVLAKLIKQIEWRAGKSQHLGLGFAELLYNTITEFCLRPLVGFINDDQIPIKVKHGIVFVEFSADAL